MQFLSQGIGAAAQQAVGQTRPQCQVGKDCNAQGYGQDQDYKSRIAAIWSDKAAQDPGKGPDDNEHNNRKGQDLVGWPGHVVKVEAKLHIKGVQDQVIDNNHGNPGRHQRPQTLA